MTNETQTITIEQITAEVNAIMATFEKPSRKDCEEKVNRLFSLVTSGNSPDCVFPMCNQTHEQACLEYAKREEGYKIKLMRAVNGTRRKMVNYLKDLRRESYSPLSDEVRRYTGAALTKTYEKMQKGRACYSEADDSVVACLGDAYRDAGNKEKAIKEYTAAYRHFGWSEFGNSQWGRSKTLDILLEHLLDEREKLQLELKEDTK